MIYLSLLQTIADARAYGVDVKMITGDHLRIAKEMSRQLDMGSEIANSDSLPVLDPVTKQKPANLSRNFGDLILAHDGFAQVRIIYFIHWCYFLMMKSN